MGDRSSTFSLAGMIFLVAAADDHLSPPVQEVCGGLFAAVENSEVLLEGRPE